MDLQLWDEGPDYLVAHEDGVVVRFRRVHESHDDVTALVRISLLGYPGHTDGDVFDGRLILTGPRSKADAVKACETRVPGLDWYALVDKACQMVRLRLEQGEPMVDLSTVDTSGAEARYLIAPFVREEEHTVLFGRGGSGKSTVALLIALLYSTGTRNLGLDVAGQGKVLYLDYEDSGQNTARRLSQLASGLKLPTTSGVFYKRASASLASMADELGRQIAQEGIGGLIVDSAALACGADPEKADSAIGYFNALRSLRVKWSVTVAHQSKTMDERDPQPFGSVFWWNSPRLIWQARTARTEERNGLHVGLWNHKNQHDDLAEPIGFHIEYSPGGMAFRPEPVRLVTEFRDKVSQTDRVLAVLEDDPTRSYTADELASGANIKLASLWVVLSRLSKKGQVMKDGEGYRLVHDDTPIPPSFYDAFDDIEPDGDQ